MSNCGDTCSIFFSLSSDTHRTCPQTPAFKNSNQSIPVNPLPILEVHETLNDLINLECKEPMNIPYYPSPTFGCLRETSSNQKLAWQQQPFDLEMLPTTKPERKWSSASAFHPVQKSPPLMPYYISI